MTAPIPTAPLKRRATFTETKAAYKTTELIAYVVTVIAVLIAAMVVDESNAGGFGAQQAWLYVTLLTFGYMISRGLAKSGSREPYVDDPRPAQPTQPAAAELDRLRASSGPLDPNQPRP